MVWWSGVILERFLDPLIIDVYSGGHIHTQVCTHTTVSPHLYLHRPSYPGRAGSRGERQALEPVLAVAFAVL